MIDIQEYLNGIVRRSGLTPSEQNEWVCEMSTHLANEVEHLKQAGCEDSEAIEKAVHRFGDEREIRKQIARQTYGATLPVIHFLSMMFFILFLVGVYLLYASSASNPDPTTWASWHENSSVQFFTTRVPISPSLMLALCLDMLMLVKTRCKRDRWALFLITSVFAALWVVMRISLHYNLAGLLVPGWELRTAPLGISDILLLSLSVGAYLFTRNKSVSRFPIILSLAIALWAPIRSSIQYHLWQTTHWNGLWGHYDPFMSNTFEISLMIGMQLLLLLLLRYTFRAIDNRDSHKRLAA